MTLASMRANGVRSLWAVCAVCHHEVVLNVDTYNEAVTIPSFGPEMVCTCCGIITLEPTSGLIGASYRRTQPSMARLSSAIRWASQISSYCTAGSMIAARLSTPSTPRLPVGAFFRAGRRHALTPRIRTNKTEDLERA